MLADEGGKKTEKKGKARGRIKEASNTRIWRFKIRKGETTIYFFISRGNTRVAKRKRMAAGRRGENSRGATFERIVRVENKVTGLTGVLRWRRDAKRAVLIEADVRNRVGRM